MDLPITLSTLYEVLNYSSSTEELSIVLDNPYVIVDLDDDSELERADQPKLRCPCPVIGLRSSNSEHPIPAIVDVLAESETSLAALTAAIEASSVAATVLVQLLRHNEVTSVEDGLFAESLAYSSLQHSAQFERWLSKRERKEQRAEDSEPLVLIDRDQGIWTITLNRPSKRNAYSGELRDALCQALSLAEDDPAAERVILRGAGNCFSAGGDLDEFGTATDAAMAHAIRMTRSAALMINRLRERTTCRLHGACIGAGIELPAYAGRVVAAENSFFQLPELSMGLIPGAGGTVSLVKRIGRLNTAYMAISNQRIDPETALSWGLIDEIV